MSLKVQGRTKPQKAEVNAPEIFFRNWPEFLRCTQRRSSCYFRADVSVPLLFSYEYAINVMPVFDLVI